jgi:hypothetical protein
MLLDVVEEDEEDVDDDIPMDITFFASSCPSLTSAISLFSFIETGWCV